MRILPIAYVLLLLSSLTSIADDDRPVCYAGMPYCEALVPDNIGFVIGYSEVHKDPVWVAYRLSAVDSVKIQKRPSRFKTVERTTSKVSQDDYKDSGYDRGHMAPNYAIATRYGREAQLQTFLMSNICPQSSKLNRGIWNGLEQKIADIYANDLGEVWVVTGPVFDNQREYLTTGVEIPDAFYKIVVDELDGHPRMIALLIPQEVEGCEDLERFIVSVDSIEGITGIDFFQELEDSMEDSLESIIPDKLW